MDLFLCPPPGKILTVGQGVLEVIAKIRTSGCTKLDRRPEKKKKKKSANKPTSPLCLNAIALVNCHPQFGAAVCNQKLSVSQYLQSRSRTRSPYWFTGPAAVGL